MTRPWPPVGTGGVVFFHAHPDDEAIFTGGTLAKLAVTGWPVTVVVATSGQLGRAPAGVADPDVGPYREAETRRACRALGVEHVEFLGYRDSGMPGQAANHAPGAFAVADPDTAARRLAAIVAAQGADALVLYDQGGIYGHPDHLQVHRVGVAAARLARIPTVYQATVDREYLHFVETHLVGDACRSFPELPLGVPTVMVTTTVDVRDHLAAKRAAIAAHRSQVPVTSPTLTMPESCFAQVYGYEWYLRHGPPGPIERVADQRLRPVSSTAA